MAPPKKPVSPGKGSPAKVKAPAKPPKPEKIKPEKSPPKGAKPADFAVPKGTLVRGAAIAEMLVQIHGGSRVGTGSGSVGELTVGLTGVIPTGLCTLDWAIGVGGYPMGRLSVLTGPEGTGKTSLGLIASANCQRMGGIAVYIDSEHKLLDSHALAMGVDLGQLVVIRPANLEQAFTMLDETATMIALSASSVPVTVVLDSIHGSVAKSESEMDYDKKMPAAIAGVMARAIPRMWARLGDVGLRNQAHIWISQYRDVMGHIPGQKEKVGGGNSVRYAAAVVIDLYKKGWLKDGELVIGSENNARVIKNQVGEPMRDARYVIRNGLGIDRVQAMLDRGERLGIVEQLTGGHTRVNVGDIVAFQGYAGRLKAVAARPTLYTELETVLRAKEVYSRVGTSEPVEETKE